MQYLWQCFQVLLTEMQYFRFPLLNVILQNFREELIAISSSIAFVAKNEKYLFRLFFKCFV